MGASWALFSPGFAQIRSVSQQTPILHQPPPLAQPIRVSSNLVPVLVSATDAEGSPVKDLQLEDFRIEEKGNPVAIAHMGEPGDTRLDMVLVFDVTGSVFARFDFEQQAAVSFLKTIFRQGDAISILCISAEPLVLMKQATSLGDALSGLSQIKPSEASTSFFDSVMAAAQLFKTPANPQTRRVQIILSDGEDNLSDYQLGDALREVQQADCIFYSINPSGPSIRLNKVSQRGQQALEVLAAQTGGTAFLVDKLEALDEIYGRIATELQPLYLLSYYSPDTKMDGCFRPIVVRVPSRPELRLRARQGYYAGKAPMEEHPGQQKCTDPPPQ